MRSSRKRKIALMAWGLTAAITIALIACVELAGYLVLKSKGHETYPFVLNRAKKQKDVQAEMASFGYLDPHLSHSHDPERLKLKSKGFGWIPGFVIYGDPESTDAIRIVALGGSTTDPFVRECWPMRLHAQLKAAGVSAVVYNGGVAGYSSNQELIKLLRDVLPLQPDIVISLSGINDLGFVHSIKEHPMVHPYQERVLGAISSPSAPALFPNAAVALRSLRSSSAGVAGVSMGPEVQTTPGKQWIRNIKLMRAISEESGIEFVGFRQPVMGVGKYSPTQEEIDFVNRYARGSDPGATNESAYLKTVIDFYGETQVFCGDVSYCVDFVDVFEGMSGLYRDARHQTGEGVSVLAGAMIGELEKAGLISTDTPGKSTTKVTKSIPVLNSLFEQWTEEGKSMAWLSSSGPIESADDVRLGDLSLKLLPTDDERGTFILQKLQGVGPIGSRTVTLELDAKIGISDKLVLAVYYTEAGARKYVMRRFEGTGQWQTIKLEEIVSAGADPDIVTLKVILEKGALEPALVDDVRVSFTNP